MPMTFARRATRRKRDFFMRQKRRDYVDRRCRRDPSLRSGARDDDAGRIVSLGTRGGRGVDFVNAQKLILWVDFCAPHRGPTVNARKLLMVFVNAAKLGFMNGRKLLMPMTFARRNVDVRGGSFARKNAHGGNGPQQELREMAEGGGLLARNAALREQAKNLSESAVHAGGGSEVAAGGIEFGKIECGADDVASGYRIAEQLIFSFGVEGAERGMNFGASHTTLATVREGELATLG